MDPSIVASFRSPAPAEAALSEVLGRGLRPEDVSLIINEYAATTEDTGLVDPGPADPTDFGQVEAEGSYVVESQIGGGIATSSRDDSVSGVEEMDNGQEVAEDMAYPESGHSHAYQELRDVAEGAVHGTFNTTKPQEKSNFASGLDESAGSVELSQVTVRGFGRVIGDGPLATSALGAFRAAARGTLPAAQIEDYLGDVGVEGGDRELLSEPLRRGGALLHLQIRPDVIDPSDVEQLLERMQAAEVRTYTA